MFDKGLKDNKHGSLIIWDYLFLEADNVTGFRERNSGKTVSFDDVYSLQMESVYT